MTIVETTCGRVEGVQAEGHVAFLGIPFASPLGRFKAPQPAAAWSRVFKADTIGKAARKTTHPIPGFAASGPQDEDCLYLNVFTPAADNRRRPVLFWIHGGGFTHGTGAEPLYNGARLARRGDVVVVTINYRLGAFGYLYLNELLPGEGLSANCGQLDQVAALQWVRDNVEAFGGDSGNVTIFGESAGAAAVGTLLGMPAARGLFHRAVLQSGAGRAMNPGSATKVALMVLEELGLERSKAARVLTVPADALLEAQTKAVAKARAGAGWGLAFNPVVDPATLPARPIDAVSAGAAADVPIVIGTNRDEMTLFASTMRREPMDDATLVKAIAATLPGSTSEQAASLIEVYRRSRREKGLPGSNLDMLDAIQSDVRMRIPATRLALAQREHQPQSFVYLFTYESPARHGALGSCHALELPFVFGTLDAPTQDRFAGTGPEVEQLSRNMMDAWLSFARSGSPAHENIGPWTAYDAASRPTMLFDRQSGLEEDSFSEERAALETLV